MSRGGRTPHRSLRRVPAGGTGRWDGGVTKSAWKRMLITEHKSEYPGESEPDPGEDDDDDDPLERRLPPGDANQRRDYGDNQRYVSEPPQ